ncbi:MAG: carboxypeptidase regulatory-like domain-containing protein [Planctomycetota bacterium]|jgi:hypothetical protein
MKQTDDLEHSIRQLHLTTDAQTDERILADAVTALRCSAEAETPEEAESLWKRAVKSRVLVIAVISVIIIAVLFGVEILRGPHKLPEQPIPQKEMPATEAAIEARKEARLQAKAELEIAEAAEEFEEELGEIIRLLEAGDVDGLVAVLSEGSMQTRLAAAFCLAEIGDIRAIAALEKLSAEFGAGDANNPFARAVSSIRSRLEQGGMGQPAPGGRLSAPVETEEKPKYIRGWLVDADDNPVSGIIQLGERKVMTTDEGAFTIRRPASEEFDAVLGRASNTEGNLGCFFIWDKSVDIADAAIVVEPLAGVSGLVTDSAANPVSDFELEMSVQMQDGVEYSSGIGAEGWQIQVHGDASFGINAIPTGIGLQLIVKKPGFETLITVIEDLEASQRLDLGRLTLKPVEGLSEKKKWNCTLSGFVIDENGEPIADAEVSTRIAEEFFGTQTDASGRYELSGLPEGVPLEMNVSAEGYGNNLLTYTCFEAESKTDIQVFPPAYDWYVQAGIDLSGYPENAESLTCLLHLEQMRNILKDYEGKQLAAIAIHKYLYEKTLSEDKIVQLIEENGINFPFAVDDKMDVVKDMKLAGERSLQEGVIKVSPRGLTVSGATHSLYDVKARPAYYIIDKNGLLRGAPSEDNLTDWIEELLSE